MRMINLVGATSVTDPTTGTVYKAGPDGVFDLPHAYATELATRHAGHWRVESEYEAAQSAARKAELRNPQVLTGVVADLRERLERAEARIEALEARGAEGGTEIDSEDAEDPLGGVAEEKKAVQPRKTAAKRAAAGKPAAE